MPTSITKNKMNRADLVKMVAQAFPEQKLLDIAELTEGFFNVAYRISLETRNVILKIAPSPETEVMTHEKNIMFSEVTAMKMIAEKTEVPVPEIVYYDTSHTICPSDYFFMDMLSGKSFSSCMEEMEQQKKDEIFYQMGRYTDWMNRISNDRFGYFGQEDKQGKNWYEVFRSMLEDTYSDADRKHISIPVSQRELLLLLERDRHIFEAVTEPKFVHWDLWAGNVFIEGSEVTGLIDFERCLWGDELMEVGFRTYGYERAFFEGYGIGGLDEAQQCRAKWYDIYLFLIVCLEADYRGYDNRDAYQWGCDMLLKWVAEK